MLVRAQWFLRVGYTCLLIDQRGSGASGGVFSFGIHEPNDVAAWARWLRDRPQTAAVFAYGVSRGSTSLIQSLASNPPLDGVAAESAGLGNIGHPYQVVGDWLGVSEKTAQLISWPFIEPSFAWVRAKHGIDLRKASSGLNAIRLTGVPVLIVQGADDRDTPLNGAMRLRDANPNKVELVVIPAADHEWFSNGKPEVMKRILVWFEKLPAVE
jgi:pimeloyl-ACP methyl ester carboxylesterase